MVAAIKRAVICGEFEGAVDCCFRFGRLADALLLAATGGRELFQRTQVRIHADMHACTPARAIFSSALRCLRPPSTPLSATADVLFEDVV